MSNKISEMTEVTTIADDDILVIVQDADGNDKKIKYSNLYKAISGNDLTGSETGIEATSGGGQDVAYQLTKRHSNVVTVAAPGDSVKLPAAKPGMVAWIRNEGANSIDIFPSSGELISINANPDEAYSLGFGAVEFTCFIIGVWEVVIAFPIEPLA